MIASDLLVVSVAWTSKLARDSAPSSATISRYCGQILPRSRIKLARDRSTARSTSWAISSGNSGDLATEGGA
jgi:hypothetical protein